MEDSRSSRERPTAGLCKSQSVDPPRRASPEVNEAAACRRLRRETRLRDLGYEESSLDEQREAIGRIVAMLEWPR